ncbi:ClpXP protease specificity-enhancing factor [Chitinibacter bivalviorum]|uniref:ClpXP protease specificity-enhancing factor n=1 Tax=Chitinibacter bivalviorum TaxID=2739434 RepID=A0A7H9BHK8_9NEIS|nr:ClpXP protease specificity-enhancing factor [Chitinibacter bivalviorum]QLG87024.1 ClpXP protease specificity-enhancing factor [Chitinibacter bivalviorum]
MQTVSTKPYLLRAIHEWCSDQGFTPYIVVAVRGKMHVPMEYVKGGEIVLNVSYNACRNLVIANDFVSFSARFNGVSRDIEIPVGAIISIFSRENGEGMGFEYEGVDGEPESAPESSNHPDEPPQEPPPRPSGRPQLRVVK